MNPTPATVAQRIDEVLSETGALAWVHAVDIDRPDRQVDVGADEPVVAASVFKVPVLVELCRRIADGTIDARQRVRIAADDRRTEGGTGIAVMLDDIDLSVRDLALLMMSVSDNRATDVICGLVGIDAVNSLMQQLGLPGTVLLGDCQYLFDTVAQDLGGRDYDSIEPGPDDPRLTLRVTQPLQTTRTTPRESTTLLGKLWRDEDLDPTACAEARRILSLQVWPHRLAAGFPGDSVTVAGKTGTFAPVRDEVGVVEYPDGSRYAVAVFLRNTSAEASNPWADRAIGRIGRIAVDALRN